MRASGTPPPTLTKRCKSAQAGVIGNARHEGHPHVAMVAMVDVCVALKAAGD